MAPTLSGRIIKTRKGKSGTLHQKNHRWESFTTKIAKLHSLDPLRKVRRHDLDAEDSDLSTSYFRNGLEKWADLDISKGFTSFKREVRLFCESLPQILHYEDKIMDLLEKYISAQEKESLESLLDLLTAFAHDLGTRFEKHYARALVLIANIAGSRQDADVIEWTFASLAFLFKYLSRLLVADLRPTFDVIAPLLGKARNPPHIARFAAEAMSFLIKKAASPSHREKSLPIIIEHARNDLASIRGDRQYGLFYHGLMTMFAEAIKGQGNNVHTTGPTTFQALLASVPAEDMVSTDDAMPTWAGLVCGITVSIIHHTTNETFGLIADAIYEQKTKEEADNKSPLQSILYVRVLGTVAGVRRGNRISNWSALLDCLQKSLHGLCSEPSLLDTTDHIAIWRYILVNTAIVWNASSMDAIIPHMAHIVKILTREPLMKWFIPFCSYLSDLDASRFRSLFLKEFQKFVVSHWSEDSNEDMLCVLIPRMVNQRALPSPREPETFTLPQSWQSHIVRKFERLEISTFPEEGASSAYDKDPKTWRDKCLPKYSALLQLLECSTIHPSTIGPIREVLLRKLKLALRPSQSPPTDEARFIVSQGFHAYLRMSKAVAAPFEKSLRPLLRAAAPRYCTLAGFLEAMHTYEDQVQDADGQDSQSGGSVTPEKEDDPLLRSLVSNLALDSPDLRTASLRLLVKLDIAPDQLDALANMLQVQQMQLDLENIRAISVHLRKLGTIYSRLDQGSWLRQAVPAFLFGMMTVKVSPIWESVLEALKEVSQTASGEEAICERAFKWVNGRTALQDELAGDAGKHEDTPPFRKGLTDFECLNLDRLLRNAKTQDRVIVNPEDILLETFEENQQFIPMFEENQQLVPIMPKTSRSQALKIMSAVPSLIEKRSKIIVPIFLSWNSHEEDREAMEIDSDQSAGKPWSLSDRKALLAVFSQFINPRVLSQQQKVYESLLHLLANGDIDIQKSALKAILAWKQEGVKPYQENLEYLLDEARFKNELTVLFQGDNKVQPEHRAEVMPVLLRLLYGRTISKKGVASGRGGLQATRLAVLRNLTVEDTGDFLQIALGDLRGKVVLDNTGVREDILSQDPTSTYRQVTARKQVGFLNMATIIINELGVSVEKYADTLLNAVLFCLVTACRKLGHTAEKAGDDQPDNQTEEEAAEEEVDDELSDNDTSLVRDVRTISLKCVISLLRNAPAFNWDPYKDMLIKEVVSPRLDNFAVENTQGISGTFQFLSTLSVMPRTALFLGVDERIIPKLMDCLANKKAKDEVRVFTLSIVRNLVKLSQAPAVESEFNEIIKEDLIDRNLELILGKIGAVLRTNQATGKDLDNDAEIQIGKDLLVACIDTIVELSPIVQQSEQAPGLIEISVFLLNQPSRRVNPKVKGSILTILQAFLQLEGLRSNTDLRNRIYTTISSLFGFFKDRPNRLSLSKVLAVFAEEDPTTVEVAALCSDLNSFKEGRIDEPDYNTRLAAFNSISKPREPPFNPRQWQPLLHNLLFYIKHDEEYGILSMNSADALCRFTDAVKASTGADRAIYEGMLSDVVLPAIYSGARESSETVRREVVRVLGYLVSNLPSWTPVSDLVGLDPPPNEEDSDPSFFSHILSPATSRQMRALQLLSKVNFHTELGSRNLAHFFVPLLEHFIFDREDGTDDHGVGAQATTTISDLAISMEWPQFRAILKRYSGYIESKPDSQKQLVRLLGKIVDSLSVAASERDSDSMDVDAGSAQNQPPKKHRLALTMPAPEKFTEDITSNIMPSLLEFIREKDETMVSSRVPVGIIIVKLLKLLPTETLEQKLPGVLSDISQILRSKAWDAREMARDTLAKMASLLGAPCFGFILDELRGALTKGYQLHVLSYTMHTILVHVIPQFQPGDLDYCLDKIVTIIMDDIFGITGQEKDAEEYTSKTKEVKSSKSQDSMELIAKTASVDHLVDLIRPLQALLLEKLDLKMVRKIDELLTRIANGLLGNAAAESRETLVFCYEVVQGVYDSRKPKAEIKLDHKLRRYLVQKGAKKSGDGRGGTSKHTYKLIRFSLDVLRSVFRKHDSLRNAANISGFIPIIGDAVVEGEEEVKIAAYKLLQVIVKVPFKTDELTKLYKIAAKDAVKSMGMSTSTTTDLAQSALKLISIILRDRRDTKINDAGIDMLLGKLKDDLTEPLYRHVTFNFLRSVLDRKIEAASVYDTLDYVGGVMITNDDKNTRDLARGAFFQFLREYPQKKNRWAKQLKFIVANLDYEREGGRLSVMEIIHLLLMKSADDFVQEVATTCFIPLVLRLANDDSEKCRLSAGELIKEIFRKADKERTSKFLALPRGWLEQEGDQKKLSVFGLAIQTFCLYFDAKEPTSRDESDLMLVIKSMIEVLDDFSGGSDWELVNTVVQNVPILMQRFPSQVLSHEELWHAIAKPLTSEHPTLKLSSIKLLNLYLDDFYKQDSTDAKKDALTGSHGLKLDKATVEALTVLSVGLLDPGTIARWKKRMDKKANGTFNDDVTSYKQQAAPIDEALAAEVVLTLVRLAKFLDPKPAVSDQSSDADNEEQDASDSDEEEEEEWGGLDEPEQPKTKITLHTLFNFLSDILIAETPPRTAALVPKVAAMDLLHLFVSTLPPATIQPSLNMLLTPLHHLTDPNITVPSSVEDTFQPRYDALRVKAEESMDVLQKKMGTEAYTTELYAVREAARKRREGRARKRKIEAVAAPEKYGKWKKGRLDKKVKRRKEVKGDQRARRQGGRY
ncbi:U3 small nucleolar RNA-associated protein 20 [Apiospora marii]|uniref:U3 small nucleolar RNA-associated protein 20 n=1 Tax=Apiospora marii TaxID=335849 RepID=UPI00312F142B